jgi:hypothetical protein
MIIPNIWKNHPNVPNHQPVMIDPWPNCLNLFPPKTLPPPWADPGSPRRCPLAEGLPAMVSTPGYRGEMARYQWFTYEKWWLSIVNYVC